MDRMDGTNYQGTRPGRSRKRRSTPARFALVLMMLVLASACGGSAADSMPSAAPTAVTKPDAGLTEVATMRESFETKLAAWYAALDVSKLDFASLPHGSLMGDYIGPEGADIASAARAADTIFVGTVSNLRKSSGGFTSVLKVEITLKGPPLSSIELPQAAGPHPTLDWKGVVIADADNAPTLLPGDHVILLLQPDSTTGSFLPLSWTGTYHLADNQVSALPGNPFASSVNGLPEEAFLSIVRAAVTTAP